MDNANVKDQLDGVDEEQLAMIASALEQTAVRYDQQGMVMVAHKMRLTADKVRGIKKARESAQAAQILGRLSAKEKAACSQQTAHTNM